MKTESKPGLFTVLFETKNPLRNDKWRQRWIGAIFGYLLAFLVFYSILCALAPKAHGAQMRLHNIDGSVLPPADDTYFKFNIDNLYAWGITASNWVAPDGSQWAIEKIIYVTNVTSPQGNVFAIESAPAAQGPWEPDYLVVVFWESLDDWGSTVDYCRGIYDSNDNLCSWDAGPAAIEEPNNCFDSSVKELFPTSGEAKRFYRTRFVPPAPHPLFVQSGVDTNWIPVGDPFTNQATVYQRVVPANQPPTPNDAGMLFVIFVIIVVGCALIFGHAVLTSYPVFTTCPPPNNVVTNAPPVDASN